MDFKYFKKLWLFILVSFLLTVSAVLGCSPGQEEHLKKTAEDRVEKGEEGKLVVKDYADKEMVLEETPQSFVSAMPSNTEVLFALGLDDKVLGVTNFCDYPPEAGEKDTIGDSYNIDIEKIVELNPDLVLTGEGQEDLSDRLRDMDIPTVVINPGNFEEIKQSILFIGRISGNEESAQNIAEEMQHRAEAVISSAEDIPAEERPDVLVLVDPESLYVAGKGTFIDELITMAGGVNIAAESGYFTMSEEKILEENPEVIINTFPMREEVLERSSWEVITAVENEDVYDIDGNLVSRPGPRVVEGLEKLYGKLHGDNN